MADKPQEAAPKKPKPFAPKHSVEEAEALLAPFLAVNPDSKISRYKLGDRGEMNQIECPWGDPTLALILPDQLEQAAKVFNQLYLPRALTALWHQDTKDIEVIWTAYPLTESGKSIADRQFNFALSGKTYLCEFGRASDRLLELGRAILTVSNPSSTNFRNMQSFKYYMLADEDEEKKRRFGVDEPRSFTIRNVDSSEEEAVNLIRHLNFYITYLDTQSPHVVIHHEDVDTYADRIRYTKGEFPKDVRARALDANLVSFWMAAMSSDNNILGFILYYRVIEYAAFHYIELSIRERLRTIVGDPAVCVDVGAAVDRVLEALDSKKIDEINRFNNLLSSQIDPRAVWKEIERNREAFTSQTRFDGGFVLGALMSKNDTFANFREGGMFKFAGHIRQIRNVLSHGKDQNTGKVITPSEPNLNRLKPWVNAIAAAAGEVVLYEAIS